MNPLSIAGAFIITLALLSYGIGTIAIQRFKLITIWILVFIGCGLALDLIAIAFMISGSTKGIFTPHGVLGYTATITMIIDFSLLLRCFLKDGMDSVIPNRLLLYSKIAYGWWLFAYITGSLLVIWP